MSYLQNTRFIVTDVETTGSNSLKDRMTEIACVVVMNGEIVSQYSSLLNPHQEIPPYIAKITGITQMMVSNAPEEYEIADELYKIFNSKNSIFVAHNVNFDYSFVKDYFRRSYKQFDMPMLCTLKLAKNLLPRDVKKNVGDMSEYFGIHLIKRHRALIDARATALSLIEMLYIAKNEHKIDSLNDLLSFQNKPAYNYKVDFDIKTKIDINFEEIPYQPGIFQFFDKSGKVIFWDYTFNLNFKLKSFFYNYSITSKYVLELCSKIAYINYETTESELSALILRNKLIKANSVEQLFMPLDNEQYSLNIPHSFLYFQAYDNSAKIIDVYFINLGKLVYQSSIGLKASTNNFSRIVIEALNNSDTNKNIDYEELKVINNWLLKQNGTGILFDLQALDLEANLNNIIKEKMTEAYNIISKMQITSHQ